MIIVATRSLVVTARCTLATILIVAVSFLAAGTARAQSPVAEPGWQLTRLASDVSTLSGAEALALGAENGDLVVRSLQDPAGTNVELATVSPEGDVRVLASFPALRNSNASGIAIDGTMGSVIVADEAGGSRGRIALIEPDGLTDATLFDVPWVMNPKGNGTGQQQFALDPADPGLLYFWDSTVSKLFLLDRGTADLQELLALDAAGPEGEHISTFTNDVAFDTGTGTLLLTDSASGSMLEVDPDAFPATVSTLFEGLSAPRAVAVDSENGDVYVTAGNSIYAGHRGDTEMARIANGFQQLSDIALGTSSKTSATTLYIADKTEDAVYELTREPAPGTASTSPRDNEETAGATVDPATTDDGSGFPWWIVVIIVAAVAVLVLLLLWARRRRASDRS